MSWLAQAPANIALIKYMGKRDEKSNLPDNASLSYTLNNLLSTVQLEQVDAGKDSWEPLPQPGTLPLPLSAAGQARFLAHLQTIKARFGYEGSFILRSCNNFPHSSGLASSASSFAALTLCAAKALSELTQKPLPSIEEQAGWSRQGSGSSCRSFYDPWVLWQGDTVKPVAFPYQQLLHQVIVISNQEKEVSSSLAHKRVRTSPHYEGRSEKAETHLESLMRALTNQNWSEAYALCWQEFQDMHELFHTCEEPFSYMTNETRTVLEQLRAVWDKEGDGPLITMDAGPNIHLLYRPDQAACAQRFKQDYLSGRYHVL